MPVINKYNYSKYEKEILNWCNYGKNLIKNSDIIEVILWKNGLFDSEFCLFNQTRQKTKSIRVMTFFIFRNLVKEKFGVEFLKKIKNSKTRKDCFKCL